MKEGITKGRTESMAEIINNMLKNNLSLDKISDLTGLSIEIVKEIKGK
jgi:predicted transposase/invertase (TIGR01784 family)